MWEFWLCFNFFVGEEGVLCDKFGLFDIRENWCNVCFIVLRFRLIWEFWRVLGDLVVFVNGG